MYYFSIHWKRLQAAKTAPNCIQVEITFLNEEGKCEKKNKLYEEWIGVCTNNIHRVVSHIKKYFPGHKVLYQPIGNTKKLFPFFEDRLAKNKLDYRSKPFYKLYTTASHKNVGQLFNRYKISYFDPDDWLVRIYIDLCTRYDTFSCYYNWYEIQNDSQSLMDSLRMIPNRLDPPQWTIAAFDIESVPLKGNHIPIGHCESDQIVMLSIYKWKGQHVQKWLLYLLPEGGQPVPDYDPSDDQDGLLLNCEKRAFKTESEMLIEFHALLEDAQVLTGYNINEFDFPCIFARLCWLKLYHVLKRYTSFKMGTDIVTTYNHKMTLDLYTYCKTFSNDKLPSFKLDDVAFIKLNESKLQVKSTGIWSWYRNPSLAIPLLNEQNVETCFNVLKPETVSTFSKFGTFRTYLKYCLKDSKLVYDLFVKEDVLFFMVLRANFTVLNIMQVLHMGNSRYLLELYKTYGTRLGYFFNSDFFTRSLENRNAKYEKFFKGKTYQGALNFCTPEKVLENVSIMDFASMYPNALRSSNLCYGTCTIMTREEWLSNEAIQQMICIPYREHSENDFILDNTTRTNTFSYPKFDPTLDEIVIVINPNTEGFLPQIVTHFIEMRQHHQKEWKKTQKTYHKNIQLGIKILINSLYGVMANKDSPLAYLPIAMTIVTLSRYQLLGSYHYLKGLGYDVCYVDTDSLMVHQWPDNHCDQVNQFLNLPYVELKYEQCVKRLLILSKKRYIYETFKDSEPVTKGFQKKINDLVAFMTQEILKHVWSANFEKLELRTESYGWIVWVNTILEANYRCRDPKKYSIYRRVKNLSEYKSTCCPSVKYLKKYPDKNQEHVEFTYSRADVAVNQASNWVMDVEDCQWVNYEQLFISQKRIFCLLLNMTFWHLRDPIKPADMVLNTLHWKRFVHAELLHYHATGRRIAMLVEPGLKYTFTINDHLRNERRPGRQRKKPCVIGDLYVSKDSANGKRLKHSKSKMHVDDENELYSEED